MGKWYNSTEEIGPVVEQYAYGEVWTAKCVIVQNASMRWNYKLVTTVIFFSGAVILRVLLCWANPPANSFDNHFKPIFMIMDSGAVPPKDACFQCYQPPVFYWTSAFIGNVAVRMGMTVPHMVKLLQFVSCFYGLLTVGVCYLIIQKLPLSDFSRLISFGTVCFLPRHIYMSAMHSNDAMSYLLVALCVYLLIIAVERQFSPLNLIALSIALTVTIFCKYTTFTIIPTALVVFFSALRQRFVSLRKIIILTVVTFLLPLSMLGTYMVSNLRHYDSVLPWNVSIYDPSAHRPRDDVSISFFTFKPWEDIKTPILAPGKLHSFWTLIYSGMWFDTEPYFVRFLNDDKAWWNHYFSWYRGEENFPDKNLGLSGLTALSGSGLITLGLFPLALIIIGFYYYISGKWSILMQPTAAAKISMSMFPVLFAFNAAGIIALTLRLPVYNSMKASYFLNSMPAFMVFLGIGLMSFEKTKILRRTVLILFGLLFTLVMLHILHIVLTIW